MLLTEEVFECAKSCFVCALSPQIPFSSDTKWMAVRARVHGQSDERVYVKGSTETVLPMCTQYLAVAGPRPMSDAER